MSDFFVEPVLLRRHRVVLAFAFVGALLLATAAADHGRSPWFVALASATLLPAMVGALAPRVPATTLAASMATTLLTQAGIAVVLFGQGAHPTALLLATFAVVAIYRSRAALLGTAVAVGVGQVAIALAGVDRLHVGRMEAAQGTASMALGVLAGVLGAWALFTIWRDHRDAERTAAEADQIASAYREVVPLVTIQLDRHGCLMGANRQTCLMLDRELEDIVGRNWFELALPEEYRQQAIEYYAMGYEPNVDIFTAVGDYTNEIVSADGGRRVVDWTAGFIDDAAGRHVSMLCVGRDVTDERAAKAEAARARTEMDALRRLAQKIASLDDARQAVVDATLELTGASFAAIAEPDRQRTKLLMHVASKPDVVGITVDLASESSLLGQAYLSGQTLFTADLASEPTRHPTLATLIGASSLVHQPVVGANGTMGVMTVAWTAPLDGNRDHALELVRLVAHEAAIALRRRESLAALERAALVDPLTSVANRRAFDAELPTALRRASESGKPLSLVVMDLNHFKDVNDAFGHEAGDEVLIECAASWAEALRAGDLLSRIGGDEFAVLLPSCDEMEMRQVIGRLRGATPHAPGASLGGATWDGVEPASQFVRRADDAQYRDKALGRDPQRPPAANRSAIDPSAPREDPRA